MVSSRLKRLYAWVQEGYGPDTTIIVLVPVVVAGLIVAWSKKVGTLNANKWEKVGIK